MGLKRRSQAAYHYVEGFYQSYYKERKFMKETNPTLVELFPSSSTNLYSLYSSDFRLCTKRGSKVKTKIMASKLLKTHGNGILVH